MSVLKGLVHMRQLTSWLRPTGTVGLAVLLVVGATSLSSVAFGYHWLGYVLGYSPGYYLGYGGPGCPNYRDCADPGPETRTTTAARGVRISGTPVGGSLSVRPGVAGPGTKIATTVDRQAPTSVPGPPPPAGTTQTTLAGNLDFAVQSFTGNGARSAATFTGGHLRYSPWIDALSSSTTTPADPRYPDQAGVPAGEIVAYIRVGGTWRELPRLAPGTAPAPGGEGFVVREYTYNYVYSHAGTAYSGTYTGRYVVISTSEAAGTFAVVRRTAAPAPVATPAPAPTATPAPTPAATPVPAAFVGRLPARFAASADGRFRVTCRLLGVPTGRCTARATRTVVVAASAAAKKKAKKKRKKTVVIAGGSAAVTAGTGVVVLKPTAQGRKLLRPGRSARLDLQLTATGQNGVKATSKRVVTVKVAKRKKAKKKKR